MIETDQTLNSKLTETSFLVIYFSFDLIHLIERFLFNLTIQFNYVNWVCTSDYRIKSQDDT